MISKFVNTGAFAIILICFLLPFLSIKCNNTTLVEFKGYDLVVGKKFAIKNPAENFGKSEKEMGSQEQKKLEINWFMVILLASVVCGGVLSLLQVGKKRIAEIFCASTGLVSLILLVVFLGNKIESEANIGNNMLDVEIRLGYEVGFWLTLLLLVGIVIYNSVLIVLDSQRKIDPSSLLNNYNSPPPIDKIE